AGDRHETAVEELVGNKFWDASRRAGDTSGLISPPTDLPATGALPTKYRSTSWTDSRKAYDPQGPFLPAPEKSKGVDPQYPTASRGLENHSTGARTVQVG